MPCLPLPSGECLPIPEWECSDVQCFQQCVNQPSFSSFFECCIQCALAHYQAEAKDHVSFVIAQAVYLFGNEYIPVADQMFMFPARYILVTQNEQVVVNDQGYPGLYRVVTASGSESISVEELGQPCLSSFGPCIPPGVTSSETLLRLGMGVSGGVGFGFGLGFGGISSAGASSPSSPAFPPPTTPPFYTPPIPPAPPPAPPPGTPSTSSTTTLVTSRSCPDVCPGCICYYMLGIEIVDPADATYSYQETPTGIVLSVPFNEIPVVSDLFSLEEAPSQLQDTTQSIDAVSFNIGYYTQVTYTVLDVLLVPRVTATLSTFPVSGTQSILFLSAFPPISRVTRSLLTTVESEVLSSSITYTPSPVLVPEDVKTQEPVLDMTISLITALRTFITTFVTTAIDLVNLNAPPTPQRVSGSSSTIVSVLSSYILSTIRQVFLSFPVSSAQQIVDYLLHYAIPEILTSIPTSNTQEVADLLFHYVIQEIINILTTSQTSQVLTAEWTLLIQKLIESIPSSQSQSILDLDLAQRLVPLISSITSLQTGTVLDSYLAEKITEVLNTILSTYSTGISYVDLSEKVSITAFGEVSTQIQTVYDVTFSSGVYSITITNNQSVATSAPFQQMLNLNLSGIISSPSQLLNLLFCSNSSCTSPLYAWIESYNSSMSSVIIWVKLPDGVPANSSITIYMMATSSSQYPYTGVSPYVAQQLGISPTQYDNGSSVFVDYWSFASLSSLPSPWTLVYDSSSSSYSFQKYYTYLTTSNANDGITTSSNYNLENYTLDIIASVPVTSATSWAIIGLGAGNANSTYTYFIGGIVDGIGGVIVGGNSYGIAFVYPNSGVAGQFELYVGSTVVATVSYTNAVTVYSIGMSSSTSYFWINYNNVETYSGVPGTFSLPLTVTQQVNDGSNMLLYVVRIRSLPPNGVMPSSSLA